MEKTGIKKIGTGGVVLSMLAGVAILGASVFIPWEANDDTALRSSDARASEKLAVTSPEPQDVKNAVVNSPDLQILETRVKKNQVEEKIVVGASEPPSIDHSVIESHGTDAGNNQVVTLPASRVMDNPDDSLSDTLVIKDQALSGLEKGSLDAQTSENPDFSPLDVNSIVQPTIIMAVNDVSSNIEQCVISSMIGGCKMMNQIPFFNIMFQQWAASVGMTCPVARVN